MKKTGEEQPPKASPSKKDLANLAGKKVKADQDTAYQNSGRKNKKRES
ncbi:hypothetical protein GWC95_12960 [Sediminibacterium roseum]|uniref:Uncharacterized protein n=1 Tax=Sediminibacterium roseum TaxID=1978412 RepID=A0ABX0A105_9BACT|nr:hypothetical protein [Sediminibacterium roseum]NCI50841.1 hypothetical protein [Sediminibacterium roseum]